MRKIAIALGALIISGVSAWRFTRHVRESTQAEWETLTTTPPIYGERAAMPHCDANVLHSPAQGCAYCNQYPDWQAARVAAWINFTGEYDLSKQPDPATQLRPETVINRWPGNRISEP